MGLWNFTPVAIIYFSAAGISFLLAFIAWRLRPTSGANVFSYMMIAAGIWILAYTMDLFGTQFTLKIVMMKIEFVGMVTSIYLWLVFVAIYTKYDGWINKPMLAVLALIPIYTLINIFQAPESNGLHINYVLEEIKGLNILSKTYVGGFYIWTSFAYTSLVAGMVLLVLHIITMPSVHRKQAYLIIPAIMVLIAANSMYVFKNNPIEPYDPTPLSLVIVGMLFIISMRKHKFLEVTPVAHSHVLTNMRSGVIITDLRNIILEINPVAENILGYTQKEAAGKSVLKVLPECQHLMQNSSVYDEIKTEIVLGAKARTFELKINLLPEKSGVLAGKLLLLYDITDQKEAISELDAYARTVAHDLKNPLNAITGLTSFLKRNDISRQDFIECTDAIIAGAMQMNNIIDGLLLLAQVRNLEKVEISKLNMQQIFSASIERLSDQIEEKKGQIACADTIIDGYGYGIWVEEVWVNLLSNAIKYGGEKPVVEVDSYLKGNLVFYTIKDNGAGLNAEEQKNIFIEFNRLNQHTKSAAGHGLGLSIVKRIIKKLNGEVGVHSIPDEGSTFYFALPVNNIPHLN